MRVTPTESGLRERKKQQTRDRIQREALRLIGEQGYEATTCEQVATAAHVSPATLFRYFATKEDLVLHDVYDPLIARAVQGRPSQEAPLTAVRRAFADALALVYEADLEVIRHRTALVLSVPALRSRSREQQDSLVRHLADALAGRGHGQPDGLATLALSGALASAVGTAVERWARDGGDLRVHVDDALAALAVLGDGS